MDIHYINFLLCTGQMGEIVTFLLTVVYAQSAFLRIREYYLNKGKPLLEKVLTIIVIVYLCLI